MTLTSSKNFTLANFAARFLAAFMLVFLTYNPSGFSWVHWLSSDIELVYKVAGGLVLLVGWTMFLRATWNSLGPIGTLLAASVFAVVIWLLIEWGLLTLDSASVTIWALQFILTGVLAVGMSWSHIRRRLSGQYDTDEIEG